MVFKSRQDLIDWAHKVGRSLGYVIVTKRSTTLTSGVMTKIHLMCDRGGIYKCKSSNIRISGSKKTNCPFRLGGKYWKKYDVWTLRVICEDHNHEPTLHVKDHPYARRLSANETRLVFDLSRKNVKPQAILSTLKEQNKNNMSTLKTVYNARQKFRRTDSTDKEDKNVDSDAEVEIRCDKGEYVGVQSDSDIEEDDSQDEANIDGLADIWNEMTVGLESSKVHDLLITFIRVKYTESPCGFPKFWIWSLAFQKYTDGLVGLDFVTHLFPNFCQKYMDGPCGLHL
ncbi:putative transcription factor FAR family [Helianthus anomalus]